MGICYLYHVGFILRDSIDTRDTKAGSMRGNIGYLTAALSSLPDTPFAMQDISRTFLDGQETKRYTGSMLRKMWERGLLEKAGTRGRVMIWQVSEKGRKMRL